MKNESFKGFEILFNKTKMEAKMQSWTLIFLFILHMFIFIFLCNLRLPDGTMFFVFRYILVSAFVNISQQEENIALLAISLIKKYFLQSALVYLLYPVVLIFYRRQAKKLTEKKHIRGSKLTTIKAINKHIDKHKIQYTFKLAGIKYPFAAETKHTLVVGRLGSGKTLCLSSVIQQLINAQKKGVIYDFKGDYLPRFCDPKRDLIFNPLDTRSVAWNVFNDIETLMDIESISNSLIPPTQSNDTEKFFADAARSVLSGLMLHCLKSGQANNAALWKLINLPATKIANILEKENHRGFVYVQDGTGKQAIGVHSTLMQFASAFQYMPSSGDFSVERFLKDQTPRFLFVTNYPKIQDTIKPVLSLLIDLISVRFLSFNDDLNRRFYAFLDEFGTLQRLSSIVRMLTLSRSKGGSVWLGIQDIGQIDKLYGQELRQAIVNACATSVMLAVADSTTAEFLSARVGEAEIEEAEESQSMGPDDFRDGINIAKRKRTEKVVMPAEFLSLPERTAYVKIPNFDVVKTEFEIVNYEEREEAITLRPNLVIK